MISASIALIEVLVAMAVEMEESSPSTSAPEIAFSGSPVVRASLAEKSVFWV